MTPKLLNILLLVSSVVLYYFIFTPLYKGGESILISPGENNIKTLLEKEERYAATLLEADRIIIQAKKLQEDYKKYDEATINKMMIMVPDSVNNLVFLDELTRFVAATGPVESIGIKDKGGGEYAVDFTVMATYTQFKEYITHWEKSMRLFSLESVTFSPGRKEEDILKFNVSLKTYYTGQTKK